MNIKRFVDKTWFLGVLCVACIVGYFGHTWVTELSKIYRLEIHIAALLFLSSFSMRPNKMREGIMSGRVHLGAFITNWIAATGFALAIGFIFFRNQPGAFAGILIVAAIPSTMASAAVWTRLAGGNDGVSIGYIFICNLSSVIITPTILAIGLYFAGIEIIGKDGEPVNLYVLFSFLKTLKKLALILILPVLTGQLFRFLIRENKAERLRKPVTYITQLLVLFMIFIAVGRAHDKISEISIGRFLVILFALPGLHILLLVVAYIIGRLMKLEQDKLIPLLFGGAQKTLPVGIYLGEEFFKLNPALGLASIPTIVFHPTQLVIDLFVVEIFNARAKKARDKEEPDKNETPRTQ
ncbi:MAG: bile acid:sodium symporter [Planctomycetota bacterium]|jgi:sodium/bile acid cotransporter 7